MNRSLHNGLKRLILVTAGAATLMFSAATAEAWWGPGSDLGLWDPHEAYLDEYGFFDPYGPTASDIRRLNRDQWRAMMGYPVHYQNVGPYGPRPFDVQRQYHRRAIRALGYPY